MRKFISTFCSNTDAFYISFLQEIDVYHESHLNEVIYCDTDWKDDYNQSCLVALSRFYASDELRTMLSSRQNHDALLIHGTWHDRSEHSWWDYLQACYPASFDYTFEDDTWYNLHGAEEVRGEFGISICSLKGIPDEIIDHVIMQIYQSVTPTCSSVCFDDHKYEIALLSLKSQSILENAWDDYPEILSGLTAAKYLPDENDVPFVFAVLVTLCELLRKVGRSHIEQCSKSGVTEDAYHYQDLLEIGDNMMGGNW